MDRQGKISALRNVPSQLEQALEEISDNELNASYRDGGWSVEQIVHHIADSHTHAYIRMMFMLDEDHPTIKPYDQDGWAVLTKFPRSVEASVNIIRGIHSHMTAIFENLSEAEWQRSAYHPERGEITIEDMLEIYHDHGRHHIEQILKARKRTK